MLMFWSVITSLKDSYKSNSYFSHFLIDRKREINRLSFFTKFNYFLNIFRCEFFQGQRKSILWAGEKHQKIYYQN